MLIHEKPRARVLWLAHRSELIGQACAELRKLGITCGARCATYEATHRDHVDRAARVQVGSVQTIIRTLDVDPPDLIVIDEAHRAAAKSYQDIVARFPRARVLGLTATPVRLDRRGLGDFFEHMIEIARPSDLFAGGWLRRPKVYTADERGRALLAKNLRGAQTSSGDYTVKAAERAVIRLVGHVVNEAQTHAAGLRKVVFAASVKHSRQLAARFRRAGITTEHLDGETPPEERAEILQRLVVGPEAGGLECVCNYDVLSEGWDLPALGCVIIARPTKSIGRFLQMVGRVQRPTPGIAAARDRKILLDHGNNIIRLDVFPGDDHAWSLENGFEPPESAGGGERIRVCGACSAMFPHEPGMTECPACGEPLPRRQSEVETEERERLAELSREAFERERLAKEARAQETKICADPDCGRTIVRGDADNCWWIRRRFCRASGGGSCAFGRSVRTKEVKICADPNCGRKIVRGYLSDRAWQKRLFCTYVRGQSVQCRYGQRARAKETKVCADPDCGRVIVRGNTQTRTWAKRFCKGLGGTGGCAYGNGVREGRSKTCADRDCGRVFTRDGASPAAWIRRTVCAGGGIDRTCLHGNTVRKERENIRTCADPYCGRPLVRGDLPPAAWARRRFCSSGRIGSGGQASCPYGSAIRAKETKNCKACGRSIVRGSLSPSAWIRRRFCRKGCR